MAITKHVRLKLDVPDDLEHIPALNINMFPRRNRDGAKRLLIVLDSVPSEDLKSGHLFSGGVGRTYYNVVDHLFDKYQLEGHGLLDYDFLIVSFSRLRSAGLSDELKEKVYQFHCEELADRIHNYEPDLVLVHGYEPFKFLAKSQLEISHGEHNGWFGQLISTSLTTGKLKTKFKLCYSLSVQSLLNPKSIANTAYLLGMMGDFMLPIFEERNRYHIPKTLTGKDRTFTIRYVDTIKKFDILLKQLYKAKIVAVDTETNSLNRIVTIMQTVQFSMDGKIAYVLPYMHKDAPWTSKELKYIREKLRDYFERNRNVYQVYTNAKFDLNVLRAVLGVRYFNSDVWDIIAGHSVYDENAKLMRTVTGTGFMNLKNLSMFYGTRAYYTAEFGKEKRATIHQVALSDDVLEYCSLDVIIPYHILRQQLQRSLDIGYDKYEIMVGKHLSDQIHAFSKLESTGALCDVDYLFKLSLPSSPINQEIEKLEKVFYESKEVKRASAVLAKAKNIPQEGLFGPTTQNVFKLGTAEHVQTLFFDVMGLEPTDDDKFNKVVRLRPNGKPFHKIDKVFQGRHKSNPIVAMYTGIGKAYKLRNAYVKSLIKLFGVSEDFRFDKRLRPTYNYDKVVTGRSSADNPNLQQIPSRSELGKQIKRLLISDMGTILLKVDFSAHEVRCWSIISGDKEVAGVFQHGADLRQQYRFVPDPYIGFKNEMEGDVHKMNASYFFGVAINAVTKAIRNAVKTVIFGLIYQQGDQGLADSTGRDVEEIVDIKTRFLDRFPVGLKWFDTVKNFAKKHFYVESPIGRRRNLTSLLVDEKAEGGRSVLNRSLRQAVNSPVQGFGSDIMMTAIRLFDKYCFDYYLETGEYPQMKTNVSVHDSLTVEVGYDWVWLAVDFIERCMTTGAVEVMQERHGMKFTSLPEMEFEIGATEKDTKAWDFSISHFKELVTKAVEQRVNDFGEKLDIDEVVESILEDQWDMMPLWAKKQYEANSIPCRSKTESVLTAADKKLARKLIEERDGINIKKHIKAYRELIKHTSEDTNMKDDEKAKFISGYEKKIEELKAA
jgi:DNA polymerase I-like protein with 3'-5' exonuclease and polymerase domains